MDVSGKTVNNLHGERLFLRAPEGGEEAKKSGEQIARQHGMRLSLSERFDLQVPEGRN
jgi:hypothetical protein